MSKYIDLHIHTTASDGSCTPTQIIQMASKKRLVALAITDHDTIDGLHEGEIRAKEYGIEFIRGCELSTKYDTHSIHILALFIPKNLGVYPEFMQVLRNVQIRRNNRNIAMLEKFKTLGINMDMKELSEVAGGDIIGRPHFAQVLKSKKIVNSDAEAFERFLKKGGLAYVPRESISANEAVKIISKIGAVPVLAHPMLIPIDTATLENMIIELKKDGLKAIEVYHSAHNSNEERILLNMAKKYDLLASGGSDFHGKIKPTVSLGIGKGGLRIPYSLCEKIKESLK